MFFDTPMILPPRGAVAWFDGRFGVTKSGTAVTAWADQSGNANNAAQTTGIYQPASTSGPPARIIFSGTCLDIGTAVLASGSFTIGMQFRFSTVPGGINAFQSLLTIIQTASTNMFELLGVANAGYKNISFKAKVAGAANGVGFSPTLDTGLHQLIITYNNGTTTATGSYTASYDGASQTILSSGAQARTGTDHSSIGARIDTAGTIGLPSVSDVAKVVLYTTVLSATDQSQLYQYLLRV